MSINDTKQNTSTKKLKEPDVNNIFFESPDNLKPIHPNQTLKSSNMSGKKNDNHSKISKEKNENNNDVTNEDNSKAQFIKPVIDDEVDIMKKIKNAYKQYDSPRKDDDIKEAASPVNKVIDDEEEVRKIKSFNSPEVSPTKKERRVYKRQTIDQNQLYSHVNTLKNLKFYDFNSVAIKSRIDNLSKLDISFNEFSTMDRYQITNKYNKLRTYLKVLDFIIAILDIFVVTSLYFEHFEYLDNLDITSSGNIWRIVCTCISLIVLILLGLRFYIKLKFENVKYILSYNAYIVFANKRISNLILECLVHILQPYPSTQFHWKMLILGNDVTYNLNMILFIASTLRLYTLLKAIKYWNYYSSEKALRILKLYKNKYINIFLYKVIIKVNSYSALGLLFLSILYIFSLFFKVLENYSTDDKYTFSSLYNCIWYLLNTMTAIGYGDFYPATLLGRIIGVLCCIIGIFLLSLVVITLIVSSQFTNDEHKVSLLIKI